ncbi:MAG: hypothetical protein IIZ92_24935, partial [Aquincola sp.]|nr:hypothetical protein [Aquincola sp.]
AFAAACYVTADEGQAPPADWPWGLKWWKPRGRRTNLVKAAALTIAEIERLDRAGTEQQAQLACLGPEWTVPAPDPVLADASFCIAVSGEGAIARVVHGGWLQLLTAFAAELWTDGSPAHAPEVWAEWLRQLQDTDEWLHDESNQPSSFSAELGETAHVSIYRLARGAA